MPACETKSERIALRTTPRIKALLQRAAASHKSVAAFLIEAGVEAAMGSILLRQISH